MKKNEFDFSVPHRQAAFAIIMILYKTIKLMVKQFFPVILVILIGGSKNKTDFLFLAVVIISALSAIFAIINYYKTYFYVKNHELFIQSGIFKKKNTSIPFERIQTINFEQHFLHQIFSVLSIKIDTAGSEKTEFEFDAIEVNKAKALRDMILAYNQSKDKVSQLTKQAHQDDRPTADLIMQLSVTDL
ncbi:MAG: PH domain-containing protein, partial [Chitinophagales bacterium]|nr:PH domain-containing protein [Chitinophagales bacterium]